MSPALHSALIVAAGAAAAGFAQGMTGFAFASVALSIWAWALPPQTAAPLAVFGALLGQLASLASFHGGFEWRKILPFVAGGAVGAPIGVFLLHNANTQGFRLAVGALLVGYSLFGLFFRELGQVKHGGAALDALFGGARRRPRRPRRHGGLRRPPCGRNCAAGAATSGAPRCRPSTSPCTA